MGIVIDDKGNQIESPAVEVAEETEQQQYARGAEFAEKFKALQLEYGVYVVPQFLIRGGAVQPGLDFDVIPRVPATTEDIPVPPEAAPVPEGVVAPSIN